MERQQYEQRCSELYEVGGYAEVREAARAGLGELGPDPVLLCWLGQAHAAEDDDDHDAEAEAAYREGLALAQDDLGLLVSYWSCACGPTPSPTRGARPAERPCGRGSKSWRRPGRPSGHAWTP